MALKVRLSPSDKTIRLQDIFNPTIFQNLLFGCSNITLHTFFGTHKFADLLQKLYNLFLIGILLLTEAVAIYARIVDDDVHFTTTLYGVDIFFSFALCLSCVVQIALPTFFSDYFNALRPIKKIEEVDAVLNVRDTYLPSQKYIVYELYALNLLGLWFFYINFDQLSSSSALDRDMVLCYMLEVIHIYLLLINLNQFTSFVYVLHKRFRHINNMLPSVVLSDYRQLKQFYDEQNISTFLINYDRITVRQVSEMHCILLRIITDLNVIYGYVALLVYCNAIFVSIHSICESVWLTQEQDKDKPINSFALTMTVGSMALFIFLVLSLLAIFCHLIKNESKRMGVIVRKLLLSGNLSKKGHTELHLLSKQILHGPVFFSAAGFFEVDLSIIYNITGSVLTYIIIIFQIEDLLVRNRNAANLM